jgi:hypothetical protein
LTGELFNTEITRLRKEDLKSIKKPEWVFNWKLELLTFTNEVYKLSTIHSDLNNAA